MSFKSECLSSQNVFLCKIWLSYHKFITLNNHYIFMSIIKRQMPCCKPKVDEKKTTTEIKLFFVLTFFYIVWQSQSISSFCRKQIQSKVFPLHRTLSCQTKVSIMFEYKFEFEEENFSDFS